MLMLNLDKLNELRRAHELDSNTEFAKLLGIDAATLYRITSGRTEPSSRVIARIKLAFPSVALDSLFYVDRLGATAGLVSVEQPTGLVA